MADRYEGPLYRVEDRIARQANAPDPETRARVARRQRELIVEGLDGDANDVKMYGSAGATGLHLADFFFRGEGWRTVVGGARDAMQETLDSAAEFRRLTGDIQQKLLESAGVPENFAKALSLGDLELPEVAEPETVPGDILRTTTSFLAGALPINRGLKAAGLANKFTRDILSSAGAAALTVPDELYTLADSLAEVSGLEEVIPEFLRSDPGDTEAEAKLKHAMNEALGVGIGTALLRPTIAALKYTRASSHLRQAAGAVGSAYTKLREPAAARIRTYWKNNLVSGLSTQLLNAGTNLANTLLVPTERLATTALTSGVRAAGTEAKATIFGLLQGLEDTFRLARDFGPVARPGTAAVGKTIRETFEEASDPSKAGTFWRSFVTGKGITDPRFTKLDPQSVAGFVEPPDLRTLREGGPLAQLGNWFDVAVTSGFTGLGGSRALISSDEIFKTPLHRMELWRMAAKEGMESGFEGEDLWRYVFDRTINPSDDMLRQALDVAQYGTFTRPLGKFGEKLLAARDSIPWGFGHAIFPFVSTPVNIFKWGALERTPLGLLSREIRGELFSPDKYTSTLARLKMTYGTGLMLLASKWAAEGRLTGSGPVDPELRQLQHGDRPSNSLLIGDHWFQLQRFQPWGFVLGFGADLGAIANRLSEGEYNKAAAAFLTSIYRNTLDFPFTQGFSEISDLIARGFREGDPAAVFRFGGDLAATFMTPRVSAQLARAMEPEARAARTVLDQVRSQLPGYREDLPVMHDALGDEVLPNEGYGEGTLGLFTRFAVPLLIRRNEDRYRAERDFLMRYEVDVGMPQRQIGGVPIDEATYQRYTRRSGQLAVPMLRDFISSGAAGGLTRLQVEREVRALFASARQEAAQEILANDPVLASRVDRHREGILEREDASMQRGPFSLEPPR